MTDHGSLLNRLRAVATTLRASARSDPDEPDDGDEHVAPLERSLVERQRQKMNDVAEE